MTRTKLLAAALLAFSFGNASQGRAEIYATGAFTGEIIRFNSQTLEATTFATIPGANLLSGITYQASQNAFYVSDIFGSAVHKVAADSGEVVQTFSVSGIGFGPSGLTVGPDDRIYAAGLGSTAASVFVLDTATSEFMPFLNTGSEILNSAAGGVGFLGGDVILSTLGAGVYRFGSTNLGPFADSFSGVAQVAVDSSGTIHVGSSDLGPLFPGTIEANHVYRFASDGTPLAPLVIDENLLPSPIPNPSSAFTSPAGVLVDADGNIVVVALGQTSPGNDPGAPTNGGIFVFDAAGQLLRSSTGLVGLSSVTRGPTAVPEPSSLGLILCVITTMGVGVSIRRRGKLTVASAIV